MSRIAIIKNAGSSYTAYVDGFPILSGGPGSGTGIKKFRTETTARRAAEREAGAFSQDLAFQFGRRAADVMEVWAWPKEVHEIMDIHDARQLRILIVDAMRWAQEKKYVV